jgi:hypothetical protein
MLSHETPRHFKYIKLKWGVQVMLIKAFSAILFLKGDTNCFT